MKSVVHTLEIVEASTWGRRIAGNYSSVQSMELLLVLRIMTQLLKEVYEVLLSFLLYTPNLSPTFRLSAPAAQAICLFS